MPTRELIDLLAAALLLGLFVQRLRRLLASRPLLSVANSRRLVFAGSMLTGAIYLLVRVLKAHWA